VLATVRTNGSSLQFIQRRVAEFMVSTTARKPNSSSLQRFDRIHGDNCQRKIPERCAFSGIALMLASTLDSATNPKLCHPTLQTIQPFRSLC
jgi:hypothetical protein